MADRRTTKGRGTPVTEPMDGEQTAAAVESQRSERHQREALAVTPRDLTRTTGAERRQMTQRALGKVVTPERTETEEVVKPVGLARLAKSIRQPEPESQVEDGGLDITTIPTSLQGEETFYAIRYTMGQRTYYNLVMPISEIAAVLPRPDPEHPAPGNRKVKLGHAQDFDHYVVENVYWSAPGLILRGPDKFGWQPMTEPVNGVQLGLLRIPKGIRLDIGILDGQHRILGFDLALERITREMQATQAKIAQSNAKGDEDEVERLANIYQDLEEARDRISSESIAVQFMVENEEHAYRQVFADIADNAMGINASVRARFDMRKTVNRTLEEVLRHSLLKDLIEQDSDRVANDSAYWLPAKNVADLIRILEVGNSGRFGKEREEAGRDETYVAGLVEQTNEFLDILSESFQWLSNLEEHVVSAKELRDQSMLGYFTTIRVIAGVYHRLKEKWQAEDFVDFFSSLEDTMTVPITKEHQWYGLPGIIEGAKAPNARRQEVEQLVTALVSLATAGEQNDEDTDAENNSAA